MPRRKKQPSLQPGELSSLEGQTVGIVADGGCSPAAPFPEARATEFCRDLIEGKPEVESAAGNLDDPELLALKARFVASDAARDHVDGYVVSDEQRAYSLVNLQRQRKNLPGFNGIKDWQAHGAPAPEIEQLEYALPFIELPDGATFADALEELKSMDMRHFTLSIERANIPDEMPRRLTLYFDRDRKQWSARVTAGPDE